MSFWKELLEPVDAYAFDHPQIAVVLVFGISLCVAVVLGVVLAVVK